MSTPEQAVGRTLDSLHSAASEAEFERYFDCFASDAVFLGTDASERWELEAFRVWARPYFDQGHGWTYAASERSIAISKDGNTAWFDERLENASLGECRGSGVLVREGESWKIAQYHLALPIPNDLIGSIVGQIRAAASRADATRGPELP